MRPTAFGQALRHGRTAYAIDPRVINSYTARRMLVSASFGHGDKATISNEFTHDFADTNLTLSASRICLEPAVGSGCGPPFSRRN
eukprot:1762790-Amphidinium_carterae.1